MMFVVTPHDVFVGLCVVFVVLVYVTMWLLSTVKERRNRKAREDEK